MYRDDLLMKNDSVYQITHDEGRVIFDKVNNKWVSEFEYRDIWGNLRVSLRDSLANPVNGVYAPPVVVQANDYDMIGYELPTSKKGSNNYLFQKQERIKDFDLDIDFFKFRPSDSKIGRFWQIDPLSEKYVYNSPYALQENKFGLGVELEGKELSGWQNNSIRRDATRVVSSTTAWAGHVLLKSSEARIKYNKATSLLTERTQENKVKRLELKEKIREITPQPVRQMVENSRPIEGERAKITDATINNPSKTNADVNAKAESYGKMGKVVTGVAAAASVYNIATSEEPIKQTAIEGGAWGGAISGGIIFAETASFTGNPIVIGGAGIIGSIVGGIAGEKTVKQIINPSERPKENLINWDAGVCFVGGTKILMANGKYKNIEDVSVGDTVKTYNLEKKEIENKILLMKESSFRETMIEIVLVNGVRNINTNDHPYYVEGKGWCSFDPKETEKKHKLKCNYLTINDTVLFIGNDGNISKVKISNIISKNGKVVTYNLSNVDGNHNFFANGVLVHNKRLNE